MPKTYINAKSRYAPQSCSECSWHDIAEKAAANGTYMNYCIVHCPLNQKQELITFKSKSLKINVLDEIKKRRAENERNT